MQRTRNVTCSNCNTLKRHVNEQYTSIDSYKRLSYVLGFLTGGALCGWSLLPYTPPPFSCDFVGISGKSGEAVSVSIPNPWAISHSKLVRLQCEAPASESPVVNFYLVQPLQGPVICLNRKWPPQQVYLKCLDCQFKALFLDNGVSLLSWEKLLTEVGYWLIVFLMSLAQDCTNTTV